jgi:hypothetical protein
VNSRSTGYGGSSGGGQRTAQGGDSAAASGGGQAAQSPASPAYKIGDTGPAGGLIFYDKGNNSGGWRYMEAASVDTEKEVPIGGVDKSLLTSQKIGAGKENSRATMDYLDKQGGGINTAFWICDRLSINGFDDWFLPSLDELLLAWAELYSNGKGDFREKKYWASYGGPTGGAYYGVDFSTGERFYDYSSGAKALVRAVRQF